MRPVGMIAGWVLVLATWLCPAPGRAAPAGLCGDLNLDQVVDVADIALNRLALAEPVAQALSAEAIARCGVVDVPGECGIRQVVVMQHLKIPSLVLVEMYYYFPR